MTTNTLPRKHPLWFYDRAAEHDAPHGAGLDATLRQQTNKLIYRAAMSTRSWVWPYYPPLGEDVQYAPAPGAQISAADTWTTFGFHGAETFGLPWRVDEGATHITFYPGITSPMRAHFYLRFKAQTLVDAVATTTGDQGAHLQPKNPADCLSWALRGSVSTQVWGGDTSYCRIYPTITLPANRRVLLVPEIKVEGDWAGFHAGATFRVFLTSLSVFNHCYDTRGV